MGEKFYRDLDEFQAKYRTTEEREQALRTMSAEKILQLSRACGTLQGAIWKDQRKRRDPDETACEKGNNTPVQPE